MKISTDSLYSQGIVTLRCHLTRHGRRRGLHGRSTGRRGQMVVAPEFRPAGYRGTPLADAQCSIRTARSGVSQAKPSSTEASRVQRAETPGCSRRRDSTSAPGLSWAHFSRGTSRAAGAVSCPWRAGLQRRSSEGPGSQRHGHFDCEPLAARGRKRGGLECDASHSGPSRWDPRRRGYAPDLIGPLLFVNHSRTGS